MGGKRSLPMEQGSMPTTMSAPTQKKRRGEVIIRNGGTGQFASTNNPVLARSTNTNGQRISDPEEETPQTVQANPIPSWWESTNAFRLFVELQIDDTEDDALDLKAMIKKHIERLRRGHTTAEGWTLTIDELDVKDICSAHKIFNIQMKCKYLSVALGIALDVMPSWTWLQCCNETVTRVNKWEGHKHIKNGETVRIWHHDFQGSNECFRNPNIFKRHGKPPLLPMLDRNPDFT
jgi:hypothetical protein